MEKHLEREKYYEETNYRTEVSSDGLKHGEYVYLGLGNNT